MEWKHDLLQHLPTQVHDGLHDNNHLHCFHRPNRTEMFRSYLMLRYVNILCLSYNVCDRIQMPLLIIESMMKIHTLLLTLRNVI